MKRALAVVVVVSVAMGAAPAHSQIALDEIVGSWQGDDAIQYVELRMLADNQNGLANAAALVFDDASGSEDARRVVIFTQNVARGVQGAKVLIASLKASQLMGKDPDFPLPANYLHPTAGRVCFGVASETGLALVDCVAYGEYTGDKGSFGPPTPRTPDNRALQRIAYSGKNRSDWTTVLDPVLENNAGATGTLPGTLCGDDTISQGEECDGKALGGASCASLGFAKGKLTCEQCHYDTTECTTCGNEAINGKEECDGGDLGERTCASLGYTGGTLACTTECKITTAACDPSFFLVGGGPPKSDCLGEWRIANATGGPNVKGKTPARQTCKDGAAGCDADGAANGTCVFTIAPCFNRADARLAKCTPGSISAWTLLGKVDAANPTAASLVSAVAELGPSSVEGVAVTFATAVGKGDACTDDVAIPVPAGSKLALRARTTGVGGKPKDADVLKLSCTR